MENTPPNEQGKADPQDLLGAVRENEDTQSEPYEQLGRFLVRSHEISEHFPEPFFLS